MTFITGKNSGYSFLELLLAVVILTLAAASVVPSWGRGTDSLMIGNAVEDMAFTMRYAQLRAVTEAKEYRIRTDEVQMMYWLEERDADKRTWRRTRSVPGTGVKLSSGFQLESSCGGVLFYPDGQIDPCEIRMCRQERCRMISTKQRGRIHVLDI